MNSKLSLRIYLILFISWYSCPLLAQQYGTLTDSRDGVVYKTVKIGNQEWFAENLKATQYVNGSAIKEITSDNEWKNAFSWNNTAAGYCWYNNDAYGYKNTYGAVYNWIAVSNDKLCPTGWHVPSKEDFTILITYLGGQDFAGVKLKEAGSAHWNWSYKPNSPATNESGFTALPSPWRDSYGPFALLGPLGCWWSATVEGENNAWFLSISNHEGKAILTTSHKATGYSVRCVKD